MNKTHGHSYRYHIHKKKMFQFFAFISHGGLERSTSSQTPLFYSQPEGLIPLILFSANIFCDIFLFPSRCGLHHLISHVPLGRVSWDTSDRNLLDLPPNLCLSISSNYCKDLFPRSVHSFPHLGIVYRFVLLCWRSDLRTTLCAFFFFVLFFTEDSTLELIIVLMDDSLPFRE